MVAFILLFVGLLLVFLEFYLPGAILGTIGGVAILASLFLFAYTSSSSLEIVLFSVGTILALSAVIKIALWSIVRQKGKHTFYSEANQKGYTASSFDETAIGKTGTVTADLKPGGYIDVEGRIHPAISTMGYVQRGEKVEVIGGQEQSLIVIKEKIKQKE